MSTSSISGLTSSLYAASPSSYATSSSSTTRKDGLLETAATALGMSTDDVKSALASGSSLADLAKDAGVSEDDLVSALEADAPDDLKGSDKLDEITKKLVETKGLPGPQGGPQGPPPSSDAAGSDSSMLDLLSGLLDTDSGTLSTALRSGTSLVDLASASGVSYDRLASVLQNGVLVDTKL